MVTPKKPGRFAPPELQILIQPPQGKARPLVFKRGVLTVGSSSYNDLVLNDAQVKPEHLRLEYIGNSILVTYLGTVDERETQADHSGVVRPKQERWPPNTTISVGEHKLTLQEVYVAERAREFPELRMARALLGPGVDLNRMGCIGTPFAQLLRVRGPLAIIFVVGLLIGTLSRWGDKITFYQRPTPTPTVLQVIVVTATPTLTPTVLPGQISAQTLALSPTVSTVSVAEAIQVALTPIADGTDAPAPTPTRMLIGGAPLVNSSANQAVASNFSAFPPVGLVDGPAPPAPVAIPLEPVIPPDTPTPVPAPAAEAAQSSPAPVITLDTNMQKLGVWVEPATVAVGADYWKLVSARWLDPGESQGKNSIMLEVLDKNGQRIVGQPLTIAWKDGINSVATNKPNPEVYAYDFPMNSAGNAYSVWMDPLPSDSVHGLGMGTPDNPLAPSQTSFYLTFQQVTRQQ